MFQLRHCVRTRQVYTAKTLALTLQLRKLTFLLYKKSECDREYVNWSKLSTFLGISSFWNENVLSRTKSERKQLLINARNPCSLIRLAKATADDVWRAHFCGYTVNLPSTIIGTKSCSDASVWEISWWFIYWYFFTTERNMSYYIDTVALNISLKTSARDYELYKLGFSVGFTWPLYLYLFRFFFSSPTFSLKNFSVPESGNLW